MEEGEELEGTIVELGQDIWTGYDKSEKAIGYMIDEDGKVAQIQLSFVSDGDEWLDCDRVIPEYDG